MPEPTAHDEGGWGDLARELGVEAPAPSRTPEPARLEEDPPPLPEQAELIAEDEGFADGLASDEGEEEADGEGEEGAEGEGGEPGQTGTGRKRRRRRRRRKKGGPDEAAAVAATVGEEEVGVVSAVPTEADDVPDEEPLADEAEVEETADRPLAVEEEDTGNDVLRELIATWNVPAWDDIIGGLYRPDR